MEPNCENLYVGDAKRNGHNEFSVYQVAPSTGNTLATSSNGVPYPMWSNIS